MKKLLIILLLAVSILYFGFDKGQNKAMMDASSSGDVYEWYYKEIDGTLYKRKFNTTTKQWANYWIKIQ
ncbi:MAG: hypothetical protein Q4D65_05505 [Peptostreptococcaceae bacterium]|nr:hypothetical protein [Peptostreptococcaceae bacterium]